MSEAYGSSPTPRGTGTRPGRNGGSGNRRGGRQAAEERHRRFAWALGAVGAVVPAIVLVLIFAFAFTYFTAEIPEPEVSQKATIVDTSGRTLADITQPDGNRTVVPLDEIPRHDDPGDRRRRGPRVLDQQRLFAARPVPRDDRSDHRQPVRRRWIDDHPAVRQECDRR